MNGPGLAVLKATPSHDRQSLWRVKHVITHVYVNKFVKSPILLNWAATVVIKNNGRVKGNVEMTTDDNEIDGLISWPTGRKARCW